MNRYQVLSVILVAFPIIPLIPLIPLLKIHPGVRRITNVGDDLRFTSIFSVFHHYLLRSERAETWKICEC